nr:hypothetical protein SHINE37_41125 [Rhizobiaceae bacterium]
MFPAHVMNCAKELAISRAIFALGDTVLKPDLFRQTETNSTLPDYRSPVGRLEETANGAALK